MLDFSRSGLVRRVTVGTHQETGEPVVRVTLQSPAGGPHVDVLLSVEQYLNGVESHQEAKHRVREYLNQRNLLAYLGRVRPTPHPWESIEEWIFRETLAR